MKYLKYLGFGFSFLAMASCTPESDCKNCEAVTYDVNTGDEIRRESAIEYCGTSLSEKENSEPVVVGDERIEWECK
jgi:hypothetical protein